MAVKQSQSRTHLRKKASTSQKAEERSEGLKSRPFSLEENTTATTAPEATASLLQAKPQRLGHSIANTLPLSSVAQPQPIAGLQRKSTNRLMQRQSDELASSTIESQLDRAKSGGQSLPLTIRRSMEGAFQEDFSHVKIHTDQRADVLNRSMQAQAFTNNNHIFFKKDNFKPNTPQGQELIAHELTHVVQQKSNTIQRKTQNLDKLQAGTVSSSMFGKSDTQKIDDFIKKYNDIRIGSRSFDVQRGILQEIQGTAYSWLENHDSKNRKHKLNMIGHINGKQYSAQTSTSGLHKTIVNYLSQFSKLDDKEKLRIRNVTEIYMSARVEECKVISQINIEEGEEVNEVAAQGSEGWDQVGEIGSGAKDTYDGVKDVIEASKKGASAVLDGMKEAGDSKITTVLKFLGSGLQGLTDVLSGSARMIVEIITGVITAIAKVINSYDEKQALEDAYGKAVNDENDQLADVTQHAFQKVRRRFAMACVEFAKNLMTTVGRILGMCGLPMVTVITETIAKVIDLGSLIVRKTKGLYKAIVGTRGKARENDAKVIITQALQGDDTALTLLVQLNPMSFGWKDFLMNLNPISVGFKKWMYDSNIPDEQLPGSDINYDNKNKLYQLLHRLNRTGNSQGFSMKKFMDLTSEKFKSFA